MSPRKTSASNFAHIKAPNWNADGATAREKTEMVFSDFRLSKELNTALADVGYVQPTAVQEGCIPLALSGIDLIVQSPTGTGKTAAFAIPTLEVLEEGGSPVEALILCPTRELAKQVAGEFSRLGKSKGIETTTVYGGTGFQQQIKDLETCQIVCATPGRLLDLLNRRALTLDKLKVFILDEADEMLNMGFEKELDAIVERLPRVRQNLLFSATVTEEIKQLASHILIYPEFLSFAGDNMAADEVHHAFYPISGMGRLRDLLKVIEYEAPENAIIFANTRDDTFLLTNFLKKHGFSVEVLNGDLPQNEREATLLKLREGRINFLVATDVAARGIDISQLSHVLNLNLPESPEVYVHRTGRTGRAGHEGVAISLISPREIGTYYILRRIFKIDFEERVMPSDEEVKLKKKARVLTDLIARIDRAKDLVYGDQLPVADKLLESEDARVYVAKLLAHFAQDSKTDNIPALGKVKDRGQLKRVAKGPKKSRRDLEDGEEREERKAHKRRDRDDDEEREERKSRKKDDDDGEERKSRKRRDKKDDDGDDKKEKRRRKKDDDDGEERKSRKRRDKKEEDEDEADEADAPEASREDDEPRGKRRERGGRRRRRDRDEDQIPEETLIEDEDEDEDEDEVIEDEPAVEAEERAPRRVRRSRSRKDDGEARGNTEAASNGERTSTSTRAPRRTRSSSSSSSSSSSGGRRKREERREYTAASNIQGMVRLHLNVGSGRLEDEESIVDMVCDLAGVTPDDCGSVTLRRRFSYIDVREDIAHDIIEALTGQTVAGIDLKAAFARR